MRTVLGTILWPTVYSPLSIFLFIISFSFSAVTSVGTAISPPALFLFFLLIFVIVASLWPCFRLNRFTSTPSLFNHSLMIWPPLFAISPFAFFTSYFLASSDQFTTFSLSYDLISSLSASVSHVTVSATRDLFLTFWFLSFADTVVSNDEASLLRCQPLNDWPLP